MNKPVGKLNKKVIKLLELEYKNEISIYIGDNNLKHIEKQHPLDYVKYVPDIPNIIKYPTYVALNPNQCSIEYIKEYKNDNKFVLVAVRVTTKGRMFVRTLFTMTERKKNIYLENGYAKKYEE